LTALTERRSGFLKRWPCFKPCFYQQLLIVQDKHNTKTYILI